MTVEQNNTLLPGAEHGSQFKSQQSNSQDENDFQIVNATEYKQVGVKQSKVVKQSVLNFSKAESNEQVIKLAHQTKVVLQEKQTVIKTEAPVKALSQDSFAVLHKDEIRLDLQALGAPEGLNAESFMDFLEVYDFVNGFGALFDAKLIDSLSMKKLWCGIMAYNEWFRKLLKSIMQHLLSEKLPKMDLSNVQAMLSLVLLEEDEELFCLFETVSWNDIAIDQRMRALKLLVNIAMESEVWESNEQAILAMADQFAGDRVNIKKLMRQISNQIQEVQQSIFEQKKQYQRAQRAFDEVCENVQSQIDTEVAQKFPEYATEQCKDPAVKDNVKMLKSKLYQVLVRPCQLEAEQLQDEIKALQQKLSSLTKQYLELEEDKDGSISLQKARETVDELRGQTVFVCGYDRSGYRYWWIPELVVILIEPAESLGGKWGIISSADQCKILLSTLTKKFRMESELFKSLKYHLPRSEIPFSGDGFISQVFQAEEEYEGDVIRSQIEKRKYDLYSNIVSSIDIIQQRLHEFLAAYADGNHPGLKHPYIEFDKMWEFNVDNSTMLLQSQDYGELLSMIMDILTVQFYGCHHDCKFCRLLYINKDSPHCKSRLTASQQEDTTWKDVWLAHFDNLEPSASLLWLSHFEMHIHSLKTHLLQLKIKSKTNKDASNVSKKDSHSAGNKKQQPQKSESLKDKFESKLRKVNGRRQKQSHSAKRVVEESDESDFEEMVRGGKRRSSRLMRSHGDHGDDDDEDGYAATRGSRSSGRLRQNARRSSVKSRGEGSSDASY
ncbi:hypothetical protein MP228_003522 [Amoeboaphelidium protococcarum]|nr:hypothetical protein MP228_003522 [Amoeboaphelidium protococcarum]